MYVYSDFIEYIYVYIKDYLNSKMTDIKISIDFARWKIVFKKIFSAENKLWYTKIH